MCSLDDGGPEARGDASHPATLRSSPHRSLRFPAPLSDRPPLPVAALATVLLALVRAFGRFDEILYLVENAPDLTLPDLGRNRPSIRCYIPVAIYA
jgi:hypothetical protein